MTPISQHTTKIPRNYNFKLNYFRNAAKTKNFPPLPPPLHSQFLYNAKETKTIMNFLIFFVDISHLLYYILFLER